MPGRVAVVASCSAAGALAIFVSCNFPEPTLRDDATDASTSSDGTTTVDGGDGGSSGRLDEASCAAPCDCDNDGIKSSLPECGNGPDCDDYDPRARPGAPFSDAAPEPPLNGNWDCNDRIEKRWDGGIDCITQCSGEGFKGPTPECGQQGQWVECEPVTVPTPPCKEKAAPVTKTQECR